METYPQSRLTLRTVAAYVFAVLMPFCASAMTAHSKILGSIPYGLYFLTIAVAGILGGLAPSLLAAALCVVSRNLILLPGHAPLTFEVGDLVRVPMLFAQATFVSLLSTRRRDSREQLGETLKVLQERSDALVQSLNASKCASWVLDLDSGRVTSFFPGSYQIFGRPFAEIEAINSVEPFLLADDLAAFRENRRQMREQSAPIGWEYRSLWPNGDVHWLEMRATRAPGERCVWRGVTVDVTERKVAEATLLRQEKLAAMGRLASTVAHEINNPLEAVTNLLYLAQMDEALTEATRGYLGTAQTELARLSDVTRFTLGTVRTNATRRSVSLASSVEDVLGIFRHRYEMKGIAVEREFEPGIFVRIAPHELGQILTNLISNACDALNVEGPRVRICILSEGDLAVFVLEDNGSGIRQEQLARVFEPFFTTKVDTGTGIGLWVTHELVGSNGGQIFVESGTLENGMSTRFRVEFPLAEPPA